MLNFIQWEKPKAVENYSGYFFALSN